MSFTRTALLAGLAALGLGSAAKADVVATFDGTNPFTLADTTAFGTTINGMPCGVFNFTVSSSTDPRFSGTFQSFCADYFQGVTAGTPYTFTPVAVSDLPDIGSNPTKLARIQELFDRFYATSLTNADAAGAFQLAVWELTYDGAGTTDITGGNFFATGGANATIAQNWLSTIDDPNALAPTDSYTLVGLYNPSAQDQIAVVTNPVPAPAGVVLVALGGLVMLARRRFAGKASTEEVAA
jgi:hypothetical protein